MNDTFERMLTDLPMFAEHNLKIRTKTGGEPIPLKLNRAQLYLHLRAEEQKKRTGKVRIIVLKGRQQGLSTYIAARFYHQTSCRHGILTFIFAHDSEGSDSLYSMVKNYYELSHPAFRPALGKSNAKELLFPALRSGYKVGSAGTGKGLGRSKTFQQLHWSEVAYSASADDHSAGILQTVADLPGTEVFLESTSAGMGDYFHRACKKAMAGQKESGEAGKFELVFIPWYWQDEYKRPVPPGFVIEPKQDGQDYTSEEEYYEMFKKDGLTLEHLAWRRNKIQDDFQGDVVRFMREYPFYPEEAFEASSEDCYIKPLLIRKARNTPKVPTQAPLIWGVDPSRLGGDEFKICERKGRNLLRLRTLPPGRVDETAARLIKQINEFKPTRVNIDCGGLGVGVYDICVGNGYGNIVKKVDFGSASTNPDINKNKRAEMVRKFRTWLEDYPCSVSCDEREADKLQAEAAVVSVKWSNNAQMMVRPKEEIKKDLGFSPDNFDAALLTFADEVADPETLKHARPLETYIADHSFNPFGDMR